MAGPYRRPEPRGPPDGLVTRRLAFVWFPAFYLFPIGIAAAVCSVWAGAISKNAPILPIVACSIGGLAIVAWFYTRVAACRFVVQGGVIVVRLVLRRAEDRPVRSDERGAAGAVGRRVAGVRVELRLGRPRGSVDRRHLRNALGRLGPAEGDRDGRGRRVFSRRVAVPQRRRRGRRP